MKVAVILRNETAGEGLAALQIKIKGRGWRCGQAFDGAGTG